MKITGPWTDFLQQPFPREPSASEPVQHVQSEDQCPGKWKDMTCWFDWLKAKAQIQGSSLANAVIAFCGNCDQLEALGPTIVKYQLISNETPKEKKNR